MKDVKNLKEENDNKEFTPDTGSKSRDFYEPVYTIGVAADKLGLSVHTLRLYETEGLIITHKTPTGRRLYSDLELEKIKCVKKMIQEEGLNFEGIRRLLAFIPCFKIRDCCDENRDRCKDISVNTRPCWASETKCMHPYPTCRDCPVYKNMISCDDVLKLVYSSFGKV